MTVTRARGRNQRRVGGERQLLLLSLSSASRLGFPSPSRAAAPCPEIFRTISSARARKLTRSARARAKSLKYGSRYPLHLPPVHAPPPSSPTRRPTLLAVTGGSFSRRIDLARDECKRPRIEYRSHPRVSVLLSSTLRYMSRLNFANFAPKISILLYVKCTRARIVSRV